MSDQPLANWSAKQRIYDENQKRERIFRSMFLEHQKDFTPNYFLNPFRGTKNQAVSDPVGGARDRNFLNKDEAFLRHNGRMFERAAARRAAQTPVSVLDQLDRESRNMSRASAASAGGGDAGAGAGGQHDDHDDDYYTRSPQRNQQQQQQNQQEEEADLLQMVRSPTPQFQHPSPSPSYHAAAAAAAAANNERLYNTSSEFGRSMLRMRASNAVLKPRTQLVGEAVAFHQQLKDAQRPPQSKYGVPRSGNQEYGWYSETLGRTSRQPREGSCSRMSNGQFYLAKGLMTNTKQGNNEE